MNAKPQTILVVVPSLAGGGAERVVSWLTREWAKEHRVTTAVFNADGAVYSAGGKLADLRAPAAPGAVGQIMALFRRVVRLRRLIRASRPDRIFGFTESANIPLLLAALSAGVPHRVTLSIRNNPNMMPWHHRLCAASLYVVAARIALVSKGAARGFVRMVPRAAFKVRVLYSPLPLGEIRALSDQPAGEAILAPGTPYLFAAGRLVPGKDFARLIDLFADLMASHDQPDLHLLIAGEGPERAALQARIDALEARGMSGHVRLLGRVDNPFAFMRGARAFLMTSRHEGFPMVLIEAMACGCPVIAFDCDFGPAEAVGGAVDDAPGFVVPMQDNAAFVARMRLLASDPALRERMGAVARARASDFDAAVIAARWLEPAGDAS